MKTARFYGKTTASLLASLLFISGTQQAQATLLDPAQSPLILSESVAPNLIFTLDDSGSMVWAYAPDNMDVLSTTRRVKAATYNPMYYNPAITYTLPVKYESDGARSTTQYSTSFTSAYFNGLVSSRGSVNLSTDYRVTWAYNPATTPKTTGLANSDFGDQNTNNTYAENAAADFNAATISTTTAPGPSGSGNFSGSANSSMANNTTTNLTMNGVTFSVKRTGTTTCTATKVTNSTNSTATDTQSNTPTTGYTTTAVTTTTTAYDNPSSCVRSSNTYTVTAPTTYTSSVTTTVTRADLRKAAVPAYYYLYDTTLAGCTSVNTDENCYRLVFVSSSSGQNRAAEASVGTDERANFARWYSFYRTRSLTTLSAANLAFTGLPRSIRLTWQTLGSCTAFNSTAAACGSNYLRKFTSNHVGNFFNWLPTVTFTSSTYLRGAMTRAGNFLSAADSPAWAANPYPLTSSGGVGTTVQEPKYSCRANYQIMMTDGMWNDTATMPSEFKPDESAIPQLPDKTAYAQQYPFVDATTKTLADLSFHYWATDASTLTDDVKAVIVAPNASDPAAQYWDPKNDPATWQHLTTYTVGLGLNSSLTAAGIPWAGSTYAGAGYSALVAGTASWPAAASNSTNNVYDLWHTAINSRGEFFSADSPDTVVAAFNQIISRISNRTTSAGAPGVTADIVSDAINRDVYQTQLNSEDWSGNLTKFNIDSNNLRSKVWDAQSAISGKTASTRNIKMVSTTGVLTDFAWSNLTPAQQAMLNKDNDLTNTPTDTKGEARLNYVRGDQSGEGSTAGTFRIRSSVLGDIINSSPVIVGTPKNVAYLMDAIEDLSGTGVRSYKRFKAANRATKNDGEDNSPRRPMVYVGANDGMLHGFDANTGEERFAFVPTAAIQNIYKLPAQRYTGSGHQYYVDGTPTVADVFFANAWHTVLVGTMRAGGRSLFALDITDPDHISLLWEKNFTDTGLSNLGYTFSQPTIARLHTGNWAAVIGNGYGNQSSSIADNASLMIFNIETGELQRELVVAGDNTKANGLSTPRLADNNSDGVADYAYAGDLQGNMWRFDLVTTRAVPVTPDPFKRGTGFLGNINANNFAVAYGGTPLYKATDSRAASSATAQAITAPPSLVRHPSTLGYLVIFGTGKYFETTDSTVDSTRAMTLYGIWDRKTKGQNTSSRTALKRSDLQAQTINSQPTNPFKDNVAVQGIRIVSNNTVQWYVDDAKSTDDSQVNKWGWALDLKVVGSTPTYSGEMVINPMAARGQTLLLNTLTPNADPCKEGVDSWQYGLDPTTGGRTKFNVFDLDNSGTIDDNDAYVSGGAGTVVSAYKKPGSGGFTTNNGEVFTAPSQGGGMKYNTGPGTTGRQSWRAIPERETSE
ncbi:type IV pilus assembly protein PilY1 [Pseudomonas sp. TE3786]